MPAGWLQIATDDYARTTNGSWGSADVGGAYTLVQSPTTVVGTSNSSAFATIASGTGLTAQLKSIAAADVQVSDTTRLTAASDTTYDFQHSWSVRGQIDGSAYTARVRGSSTGKASLGLSRLNGKVSTWLTGITLPFTVSPGQTVHGEIQAIGSSPVKLNVRAWVDGDTAPSWQMTYSDSSAAEVTAAGSVILSDFVTTSSSPLTVAHDDLAVDSNDTVSTHEIRGSVPVGTATYAVPANAIFVDPSTGRNTNLGTVGSPFQTVTGAVLKAPSGSTLVLRGGTYHESVTVQSNKTDDHPELPR